MNYLSKHTFILNQDSVSVDCYILTVVKSNGDVEFWFRIDELATFLSHFNNNNQFLGYISDWQKSTWRELTTDMAFLYDKSDETLLLFFQPETILVNETGVWKLLMYNFFNTTTDFTIILDKFQYWLCTRILPDLRRYCHSILDKKQIKEKDDKIQTLTMLLSGDSSQQQQQHRHMLLKPFRRCCDDLNTSEKVLYPTTTTPILEQQHHYVLKLFRRLRDLNDDDDNYKEYKFMRVQEKNLKSCLKRMKHPDLYEQVLTKYNVPIDIVDRVKQALAANLVEFKTYYNTIRIFNNDNIHLETIVENVLLK